MFTFKSPVIENNIWNICFKPKEDIYKIYYEDKTPEYGTRINGITEYFTSTIYIDKELDGFLLIKTLRHELMHLYLWETGQQGREYTEEELCEIVSVAAPLICKTADEIISKLEKEKK